MKQFERRNGVAVPGGNSNVFLLGFLVVMIVFMFLLNSWGKRKAREMREKTERELAEKLAPGVWVRTSVGFYGRFVDRDGDVVILETPGGEETYWDRQAIRSVADPPFAQDESPDEAAPGSDGTEAPHDDAGDAGRQGKQDDGPSQTDRN